MRWIRTLMATTFLGVVLCVPSYAQEEITIVAPATETGEDLDLYAVIEIFKESESIEDFEKRLNDPDEGVNNIDLDGDGQVDFIRVFEYADGNTHVLVLEVAVSEDTYQDLATIEIEKAEDSDEVNAQVHGDEEIYGVDYYIEPVETVYVTTVVFFGPMFRPGYRLYRPPWRWGRLPRWWRPYPRVSRSVYRSKTARHHQARKNRHTTRARSTKANNVYRTQRRPGPGG
jgi:hypothetical protein